MHQAALDGREELVKLLLDYNADFTLKDGTHKTPLDLARQMSNDRCANLIKDAQDTQDGILSQGTCNSIPLFWEDMWILCVNRSTRHLGTNCTITLTYEINADTEGSRLCGATDLRIVHTYTYNVMYILSFAAPHQLGCCV